MLPTFLQSPDELDVASGHGSGVLSSGTGGLLVTGANGIPYGSRRSLRKMTEDEIILRDKMLAIALPEKKNPINITQKPYLASVETLNASEKHSFYDEEKPMSGSVFEEDFVNNRPNNKKTWSNENLDYSSSRLSLQEIKQVDDSHNGYKGSSVDALYENNGVASMLIIPEEQKNRDITIVIPNNDQLMKRSVSQRKRQQQPFNNNLRRKSTLRNSNYFQNMRIHRNSIHYRGALLNTHRYRLRASSCPNIYRNSMTTLAREDEEVYFLQYIFNALIIFYIKLIYLLGMVH